MKTSVINKAVVKLMRLDGHGVLVPGGFILTAAHCVDFRTDGSMVLGDYITEPVMTKMGEDFMVAVAAIEPCSDIAALCGADMQEMVKDWELFERFSEDVPPVPIAPKMEYKSKAEVLIRNADGSWVKGMAQMWDKLGRSIAVDAERRINGGASGGPIINTSGELVAIISSTELRNRTSGPHPVPSLTLPAWVCRLMK